MNGMTVTQEASKRLGCRGTKRGRGTVRVCIVYEHALFAHGIKRLLEQQASLRMIGMIERQTVVPRDLRRLRPDVVVVEGDGSLTVLESLEGVTAVAISLRGDEATILTGRPIRVSGPEELADVVRSVARKRGQGRRSKVMR